MKSAWLIGSMLLGVLSKADNQLRDFPACGFRNELSTVDPFIPEQVQRGDECLWDCTWVENPFYRANWTVQLIDEYLKNPENLEEKVVFRDVKYFMMTPKIPKDLTCMDGCLLPRNIDQGGSGRFRTDCGEESEGYFNCYLNNRKKNSRLARPRRKVSPF